MLLIESIKSLLHGQLWTVPCLCKGQIKQELGLCKGFWAFPCSWKSHHVYLCRRKKKSLLRKKKKNLKRRRLEGKSHMEHQRRGGQAQRAQSHPQQNLSQKQPLEILSLYYRALKENENKQEAGMVLSSLHKSWTAPGSPFFFLPVLRNSAATEEMISPVYTTHNSIVGFDVSKGSFNPNE